jgi:hypothetical protein
VTTQIAGRLAALFPFIPGGNLIEFAGPAPLLPYIGASLAFLHRTAPPPNLASESFRPGYEDTLRRLDAARTLPHAAPIFAHHEAATRLGESLRGCQLVLTHGDPNGANWLIDDGGKLWLCDWSDLGLGPRERDLFSFSDFGFAHVLRGYGPYTPDPAILRYYSMRWVLQEICDYGSRLLAPGLPTEEEAHACAEFDRYLAIAASVTEPRE